MSLEEKLKIKQLSEVTIPARQAELLEITGSPVVYDVAWASFAGDMEGLNFVDNLACHRLNMALRVICMDQLGKDAIRESLATVKITNVKTAAEKRLALTDRVLEMDLACALKTDGMHSDNAIREFLLKHL